MAFKVEELIRFANRILGQPYWYGTCGYECSDTLLKNKAIQYPTHYTASRKNKYLKDIADKKVCMDCIGLFKAFFWTNGGQSIRDYLNGAGGIDNKYGSNGMPDKSANEFLNWLKAKGCKNGKINTIPEKAGIAVFKNGHVGLYIGNGKVVEARGFSYGVVKTDLKLRPWTNWAELPPSLIEYSDAPGTKVETTDSKQFALGDRNLKLTTARMTGDDVKELQTSLGSIGFNCGEIDGIFGKKTEASVKAFQLYACITVDGIFGKISYQNLLTELEKRKR